MPMIDYEEDWICKLFFRAECRVVFRALLFAVPAALLAVGLNVGLIRAEDIIEASGLPTISDEGTVAKPATWLALIACLILLLDFRQMQALARFWEGTSLLHQMRGEWFDSVSCLVTFAMLAAESKPAEVKAFRHTIVRLMSLCHSSALEEIADMAEGGPGIARLDFEGLDPVTTSNLRMLKEKYGFNRVEMVLKTIYTTMTKALEDGVLKIPPPILTRVYQTISRGFVCILNAKKITDTRFPFPYAHLIAAMLLILEIVIPCLMSMLIRDAFWAAIFTFVPVFGLFSLNFIAIELENPFGNDDNDLPLAHFQSEMNSSLLMLLHGNADLVPSVTDDAVRDFHTLAKSMGFYKPPEKQSSDYKPGGRMSHRVSSFECIDFDQDMSASEVSPLPSEPSAVEMVLGNDKGTEPDAAANTEMFVKTIVQNMVGFNRSLQKWSQMLETQVGELQMHYDTVKQLSIPSVEL